jgi:lantibiotic modifying enzyme
MTWGTFEGGSLRIPLGLYNGLSGIAWLHLELYRLTGEARYLEGARSAVEIILDRGLFDSGSRVWENSTDIISGAAGTGLLLLRAASVLKNPRCLASAEAAGDFLIEESIQTPAGLKWKINVSADRVYPNFAHGTAGVAYFLSVLYQTTGRTRYLTAALEGARELQFNADENSRQKTCAWFHHEGDGEDLWYVGWCHGPAGTARLFYQLSRKYSSSLPYNPDLILEGKIPSSLVNRTGNDRPMAWVECAANWLLSSGIPEPRKPINGYWNEGICCGTAGVGEFFVDLYLATKKPDYLRAAERMALHLAKTAERVGSGYRWVQAEDRASPQKKDAQTGYAQGCAGIGLFFLKLSRAQRGNPIGWRLPDNPF